MGYIKWAIILTFWTFVAAFLHYTLPHRDIVYVQGTEIIRQDFSRWNRIFFADADVGNEEGRMNRDLRLINATQADGDVIVYRNEDTGFGWPPYFKLDSANLQAEAQNVQSTRDNPHWHLLTHYGWRLEFMTIYPNAISLRPHPGPDAPKPLPWLNIIIVVALAVLFLAIRARWRRFRARHLETRFENWQDNIEATGDAISDRGSRLKRWLFGRRY